ncbi:hypothetical protein [Sinomicrobium oceani]|uniref:hypothetical protein n=1 Tax=Sinomicrobium oceani TaxID=1150368 RepID=UPI00227CFE42|nr:hypothetical protein [Sinomicrobium oceani]
MIERKLEFLKVGETYLKFNFEFTKSNQDRIKRVFITQVNLSSSEILKNKALYKISIEYDEGSLKTRIVIWGTAFYLGIANYGSFRAGVREIINDVRWFSENVIERMDDGPDIDSHDIIRTEKRTGLTGRIQDVYYRIDRLDRNINNLSNNEMQVELQQIKQEVSNLVAILPDQDGEVFLNDLGDDYSQNLPNPNERKVTYLVNRYGLKPDEEIEFIDI